MQDQQDRDDWIADLDTPIATFGSVADRSGDKVFEYLVSVTRRAAVRA